VKTVKIETKSFNEIPAEIQELAKKKLKDGTEVFEVTVFDYCDGNKEYTVKAIDDAFLIEVSVHNKRGIESVDRVSLGTVISAIEKIPRFAKYFSS
jgi:hypothetical protein